MKQFQGIVILFVLSFNVFSQEADSILYQEKNLPYKVHHAEPLYVDLIRDLGARKGEREWNVGFGMVDNLRYDKYIALVEYEWAPIDRLGLEVELPLTIYSAVGNGVNAEKPSNRLESIKTAAQWTFLVSEKHQTSVALGYLNEVEFTDLNTISRSNMFSGNLFNPFLIAAKRWGDFHSLIYTGPQTHFDFKSRKWNTEYEWNTSIHYMIPGTRNFLGVEVNKMFFGGEYEMTLRPQMRVVIHDALMIGIVQGIPISKERERLSSFLRLIYEPRYRKPGHK
jgi:hypothetical protein